MSKNIAGNVFSLCPKIMLWKKKSHFKFHVYVGACCRVYVSVIWIIIEVNYIFNEGFSSAFTFDFYIAVFAKRGFIWLYMEYS